MQSQVLRCQGPLGCQMSHQKTQHRRQEGPGDLLLQSQSPHPAPGLLPSGCCRSLPGQVGKGRAELEPVRQLAAAHGWRQPAVQAMYVPSSGLRGTSCNPQGGMHADAASM